MDPKIGLLICCFLRMILAKTDGDILKKRIRYTKLEMKQILDDFLSANNFHNFRPWPEPIPELDLKNLTTEEKRHRAQCGLHFMQEAVKLIREHQSDINRTRNPISKKIDFDLNVTIENVKPKIGPCTNETKKPIFPHTHTFERKQWGATVLKMSVDFLQELENSINHMDDIPRRANHAESFKPRRAFDAKKHKKTIHG